MIMDSLHQIVFISRIVASSEKGLDKYNDCYTYRIELKFYFNRERDYTKPVIEAWISHNDVEKVKGSN